jgi:hypothetical protein
MVTKLYGVLQFLSNSYRGMGRCSTHNKFFLMTFQKVVKIILKHFLMALKKLQRQNFSIFFQKLNIMTEILFFTIF